MFVTLANLFTKLQSWYGTVQSLNYTVKKEKEKSCNKISNKNKKNPEKEDEHQREWTMFIEQTIRGRLVETELIVQVLSSGVVIQVVNRETWLFGSLRDQSI